MLDEIDWLLGHRGHEVCMHFSWTLSHWCISLSANCRHESQMHHIKNKAISFLCIFDGGSVLNISGSGGTRRSREMKSCWWQAAHLQLLELLSLSSAAAADVWHEILLLEQWQLSTDFFPPFKQHQFVWLRRPGPLGPVGWNYMFSPHILFGIELFSELEMLSC